MVDTPRNHNVLLPQGWPRRVRPVAMHAIPGDVTAARPHLAFRTITALMRPAGATPAPGGRVG